eukprot:365634-Chlamydomonas_euryale.AAC.13
MRTVQLSPLLPTCKTLWRCTGDIWGESSPPLQGAPLLEGSSWRDRHRPSATASVVLRRGDMTPTTLGSPVETSAREATAKTLNMP